MDACFLVPDVLCLIAQVMPRETPADMRELGRFVLGTSAALREQCRAGLPRELQWLFDLRRRCAFLLNHVLERRTWSIPNHFNWMGFDIVATLVCEALTLFENAGGSFGAEVPYGIWSACDDSGFEFNLARLTDRFLSCYPRQRIILLRQGWPGCESVPRADIHWLYEKAMPPTRFDDALVFLDGISLEQLLECEFSNCFVVRVRHAGAPPDAAGIASQLKCNPVDIDVGIRLSDKTHVLGGLVG